jgi:hypothetical protein
MLLINSNGVMQFTAPYHYHCLFRLRSHRFTRNDIFHQNLALGLVSIHLATNGRDVPCKALEFRLRKECRSTFRGVIC